MNKPTKAPKRPGGLLLSTTIYIPTLTPTFVETRFDSASWDMEIQVSKYTSREELETHIVSTYGRTVETTPDVFIVGTNEELAKLQLRHGQRVWGIPVTATDYTPKEKVKHPARGKKVESFLNSREVSIKKRKKYAHKN